MKTGILTGVVALAYGLCGVAIPNLAQADDFPALAQSAEEAKPLEVGQSIPEVTLKNSKAEAVSLRELIAQKKTALIFYRGGWCPFCNKHLKEVAELQGEIVQNGYQVVAINPDRPEDIAVAEGKNNFPFLILSDSDMEAAAAFGLAFKLDDETIRKYADFKIKLEDSSGQPRYSLPVPAFYLIGTDGKITFAFHDADYKVRISKEALLHAVRSN